MDLLRAVRHAAGRLEEDARTLLDRAMASDWTIADLHALGKDPPVELRFRGTCRQCGATITAVLTGQSARRGEVQGAVLGCPVCTAVLRKAGGDPREAPRLGALE